MGLFFGGSLSEKGPILGPLFNVLPPGVFLPYFRLLRRLYFSGLAEFSSLRFSPYIWGAPWGFSFFNMASRTLSGQRQIPPGFWFAPRCCGCHPLCLWCVLSHRHSKKGGGEGLLKGWRSKQVGPTHQIFGGGLFFCKAPRRAPGYLGSAPPSETRASLAGLARGLFI